MLAWNESMGLVVRVKAPAMGPLTMFDTYARAAIVQRARIRDGLRGEPGEAYMRAYADAHFFWSCVDKVNLLFDLVRVRDGGADLKLAWRQWAPLLDPADTVRNLVEHIDGEIRKGTSDLGNWADSGTIYTFDGQRYDIDAAERAVTGAHAAIVGALLERPPYPPDVPPRPWREEAPPPGKAEGGASGGM